MRVKLLINKSHQNLKDVAHFFCYQEGGEVSLLGRVIDMLFNTGILDVVSIKIAHRYIYTPLIFFFKVWIGQIGADGCNFCGLGATLVHLELVGMIR